VDVRLDIERLESALGAFRGRYRQRPPAVSAKRIGGERAYDLARADSPVELEPVEVDVEALTLLACREREVDLRVTASAGFYVRSLAHDLGAALGVGGHLAALRRERSGRFGLDAAVPLGTALSDPAEARSHVIPPVELLPDWPAVALDAVEMGPVGRGQAVERAARADSAGRVRLVAPDGRLVALADVRGRLLHPFLVLV
jgi:tRNA pseudouridine55 synthase